MSVTKTRPSGLSAMKRTRFSPSAATLRAKPSGKFNVNDFPFESRTRFGTSLAVVFDVDARRVVARRCAAESELKRRSAANAKSIRRPFCMRGPFGKGSEELWKDDTTAAFT